MRAVLPPTLPYVWRATLERQMVLEEQDSGQLGLTDTECLNQDAELRQHRGAKPSWRPRLGLRCRQSLAELVTSQVEQHLDYS